jgi:hypothetical protein
VGATRHDRSDQLRAAYAALALAAFIEEASRLRLPFDVSKLRLDKRDAIGFGGGRATFVKINRAFVEDLLEAAVPMPNPIDTRETLRLCETQFKEVECSDGVEGCGVGVLGSAVVGVHAPPNLVVGDRAFDHVSNFIDRGIELFLPVDQFPSAGLWNGVVIPVPM